MKKKSLIAITLIICFLINALVFAEYTFEYYVTLQINNTGYINRYGSDPPSLVQLDENDSSVKPIIHEGRTMVPMRAIISIIPIDGPPEYDIEWDGIERKAVLIAKDYLITRTVAEFKIGSASALFYDEEGKNPRQVTIPAAPMIINDRTYLPLRAVVDSLTYHEIEWIPAKQGIVIYFTNNRPKIVTYPDGSVMEF